MHTRGRGNVTAYVSFSSKSIMPWLMPENPRKVHDFDTLIVRQNMFVWMW